MSLSPPSLPNAPAAERRWFPNGLLALALALPLLAWLMLPLYQLLKGIPPHYENGFDESTYLQYDYSRANQGPARPGQYVVTLAHEVGLSGGWIDLLADVGALVGLPLLVRAVLRRLGWGASEANLGALGFVLLPQLVLTSNPLIQWLHTWTLSSGMIYWITLPVSPASPLARTPEPQASFALLGVAVLLGLVWRRFWPVYGVLPFLYPFVSIPAAFVTLACDLHRRWAPRRFATAGPLVAAFLAIGAGCWAYYGLLVGESVKRLVTASHAPLLSVASLLTLALYAAARRAIAPEHRFAALALALASAVGANQQLISGRVPQPYGFEYYVGSLAFALVATLALRRHPRAMLAALAVGAVMVVQTAYPMFRVGQGYMIRLPLTDELKAALKQDSAHVVVNDPANATLFSMLYPRQPSTALGYERSYTSVSARNVAEYRCVKKRILADYGHAFDYMLQPLDLGYMYGGQNFVFVTLNRVPTPVAKLNDVSPAGCTSPEPTLRYFFINWFPPPKRLTAVPQEPAGRSATQPSAPGSTRQKPSSGPADRPNSRP